MPIADLISFDLKKVYMEQILSAKAPPDTVLRPLQLTDFDKDYFGLLSRLTVAPPITREEFGAVFRKIQLNSEYHITLVLEDLVTDTLLASGTLLIEPKFIHRGGLAGHIEDIVVRKETARRGFGYSVVTALCEIARAKGCYKVVLDCSDDTVAFYVKCGLERHGNQMQVYFSSSDI